MKEEVIYLFFKIIPTGLLILILKHSMSIPNPGSNTETLQGYNDCWLFILQLLEY